MADNIVKGFENVKRKIISYSITCLVSLLVGASSAGAGVYFYTKNTVANVGKRAEKYKERIANLEATLKQFGVGIDSIEEDLEQLSRNQLQLRAIVTELSRNESEIRGINERLANLVQRVNDGLQQSEDGLDDVIGGIEGYLSTK